MRHLVRLCHHGWVVPLVALIGRDRGARFAVLLGELQVARSTLQRALDAADELDLLLRNPGYGHPLRPEYLLSPRGEAIAPACREVHAATQALETPGLARRKWSLPVLAALAAGDRRFADLQRTLPACSPRALARALDDLEAAGWVQREVVEERPPRPRYRVASAARALARAAIGLAEVTSG